MKIKVKLSDKTKEELKGVQGVQGIKGDKGDVGSKGLDGKTGNTGNPGKDGKDGNPGKQGLKGEKGLRGFKGDQGNDGVDGEKGQDGSPDTPIEIKDKLEILRGEKRLDASAIKNLTNLITGGERKIFTSKDAGALYLKLDCSNDPLIENLDIGIPLTGTRMLRIHTTDDGLGTTGILIPDANLGRGSWINPNGQDGVQVDANGDIVGAMNQNLWFQYYSSGDLNLCFGGGDVIIAPFAIAGFVKNTAVGVLTGGNTIAVADITDIATNYLKLAQNASPQTVSGSTFPVTTFQRETTGFTAHYGALMLKLKTTADMADDFGPGLNLAIQDSAGVENFIAMIGAVRDGADNSGKIYLDTYAVGVRTTRMTIDKNGLVEIGNDLNVTGDITCDTLNYTTLNPAIEMLSSFLLMGA